MHPLLIKLVETIKKQQPLMVEQLEQFCTINSGTDNLEGLAQMRQVLQDCYAPLADTIQIKKLAPVKMITMEGRSIQKHYGEALFISKRPHLSRRILLSGHMDTVYSADHPFQKLTYRNASELNGPGVADMKGGLIVMLQALAAFEQTPFAKELGWDVLINADEEIGSLASQDLLEGLAPNYKAALVYEPAMSPEGTLAKNRSGSGKFTIISRGKSAHVGRAFQEGRNAICHLAAAVNKIHALNGLREGVTINVGKIAGGDALNMVPDQAVAKLDVRIAQPEDASWVKQQLNRLLEDLKQPGYSLQIEGDFTRPVKSISPGTERLFQRIQKAGDLLGVKIDWQDSGGCCDGNNLAQQGLPVIDTLGVRGGKIHSSEEFIILDSLHERAALSALLLADLAQGGLEDLKG